MHRPDNHVRQLCTACKLNLTSSRGGLCWACKPAPTVELVDGDLVRIGGGYVMSSTHALVVAHAIIQALSP
jgi:hypothetical protein